jgi:hypothetical protein
MVNAQLELDDSKERDKLLSKIFAAIKQMDESSLERTAAFAACLEIDGIKRDDTLNERKRDL